MVIELASTMNQVYFYIFSIIVLVADLNLRPLNFVRSNGVFDMVKYAATRSGSKYVVGREGWKSMIVNKLTYECGALAWYQHECDDLEVRQNGMGRWICDVGNVRTELIRGETGLGTFEETKSKTMVK